MQANLYGVQAALVVSPAACKPLPLEGLQVVSDARVLRGELPARYYFQ